MGKRWEWWGCEETQNLTEVGCIMKKNSLIQKWWSGWWNNSLEFARGWRYYKGGLIVVREWSIHQWFPIHFSLKFRVFQLHVSCVIVSCSSVWRTISGKRLACGLSITYTSRKILCKCNASLTNCEAHRILEQSKVQYSWLMFKPETIWNLRDNLR